MKASEAREKALKVKSKEFIDKIEKESELGKRICYIEKQGHWWDEDIISYLKDNLGYSMEVTHPDLFSKNKTIIFIKW